MLPTRLMAVLAIATASVVSVPSTTVASAPPPPVPASLAASDQVHAAPVTTAMTPASAWNTVKYNRLYRTGQLAASKCREPRYPLNSAANIRAWHISFTNCLNNVWVWKIRAAKYRFVKPTIVIHTNGVNSPCGRMTVGRAAYCPASRGIYIGWKRYANLWARDSLYVRAWAAFTIAHEYGHHVQQMTGILAAQYYRQRYVLKTTATRLEENRRMELQATCMSAAYLGADRAYYPVAGAFYQKWAWLVRNLGDENNPPGAPRTHGSKRSHNFWSTRGFNYKSAYTCMTWSAAPSAVA